jgi:glycosyltransferase involved in cell wall biosynthesis
VRMRLHPHWPQIIWIMDTEHKPLVSILIPSRYRVDMLKRCIESIQAAFLPEDYEILIRSDDDDVGTRETVEALERKHSNLKGFVGPCWLAGTKRGFTPSVNRLYEQLAKEAKAPWIWIMNDDCTVESEDGFGDLRNVPLTGYLVQPGTYKLNQSRYDGCEAFPIAVNQAWLKLGADAIGHPTDFFLVEFFAAHKWKVKLLPGLTVWHDWKEPVLK